MTSRPSTAAPILAVLAIVLATLGAYVGGYFLSGDIYQHPLGIDPSLGLLFREYDYESQATMFKPAATVESCFRGTPIETTAAGEPVTYTLP